MLDVAWQWLAVVFGGGLILGSFLNVVIYRLPLMPSSHGQGDERDDEADGVAGYARLSLAVPASHCPACQRPIAWRHNVPLLGYLFLRGRCAHCRAPISPRYPIVEMATALACVGVALVHGGWPQFVTGVVLVACLIALATIDLRDGLLPDAITLPLLWLGLIANSLTTFTDAQSAIIGAVAGYLSFFVLDRSYAAVRKQQGLGGGDVKLLAALGAWFGWQALPGIVLLASVSGLAASLAMIAAGRWRRATRIPFGPYLALAGWLCLMFADTFKNPLRWLFANGHPWGGAW